jgi:cytochrome c
MRARLSLAALLVVALAAGALVFAQQKNRHAAIVEAQSMTGGDAARGQQALESHQCGACHQIPGVEGADGGAGPSLKGFAGRAYIAGRLSNTPHNLEAWIIHPHNIDPQTAMPELGVTANQARDMSAYLYAERS